jgi:hypothetical protein
MIGLYLKNTSKASMFPAKGLYGHYTYENILIRFIKSFKTPNLFCLCPSRSRYITTTLDNALFLIFLWLFRPYNILQPHSTASFGKSTYQNCAKNGLKRACKATLGKVFIAAEGSTPNLAPEFTRPSLSRRSMCCRDQQVGNLSAHARRKSIWRPILGVFREFIWF